MISVQEARQTLVAELTWTDAKAFLERARPPGLRLHSEPALRTAPVSFVVLRGKVVNDRGDEVSTSLAMLLDREVAAHNLYYLGLGRPWDTVVPPHARDLSPLEAPRLNDVSRARAEIEVGRLVEPTAVPAMLGLWRININPIGSPVDPTGATFSYWSVTFIYTDPSGRPRLWLSQSSFPNQPRVGAHATTIRIGGGEGSRYAQRLLGKQFVGLAWQRGDRWLYLAAELTSDLNEKALMQSAASIRVTAPRPPLPSVAGGG